jgi:hypothetical protein
VEQRAGSVDDEEEEEEEEDGEEERTRSEMGTEYGVQYRLPAR